jgi:hypothetical protein
MSQADQLHASLSQPAFKSVYVQEIGGGARAGASLPSLGGAGTYGPGYGPFGMFQEGGIALRPMIARLAETEPEFVLPLSKLGEMRGGGQPMIFQFNNYGPISSDVDLEGKLREFKQEIQADMARAQHW